MFSRIFCFLQPFIHREFWWQIPNSQFPWSTFSNEETFLQEFRVILKHSLQNYSKYLETCFLIADMHICLASSKFWSHYSVLPVSKWSKDAWVFEINLLETVFFPPFQIQRFDNSEDWRIFFWVQVRILVTLLGIIVLLVCKGLKRCLNSVVLIKQFSYLLYMYFVVTS